MSECLTFCKNFTDLKEEKNERKNCSSGSGGSGDDSGVFYCGGQACGTRQRS